MPSRAPSTAPASSTAIGCNVNGTAVHGTVTLTCAAVAVAAVAKSTAPAFSPNAATRESRRSLAEATSEREPRGAAAR